jgi:hypothetical protein
MNERRDEVYTKSVFTDELLFFRRRGEDISFISFVENSTNSGIILSPQLLMTSLNGLLLGEYIKEVDAGYIVKLSYYVCYDVSS